MLSKRMFLSYVLVLLALSISVITIFYFYSKNSVKIASLETLGNMSYNTITQLDMTFKSLDSALINISTSEAFLDGLETWQKEGEVPPALRRSFNDSLSHNELLDNRIYRTVLINKDYGCISYGHNALSEDDVKAMLETSDWQQLPSNRSSKQVLSSRPDPWLKNEKAREVTSIIRNIVVEGKTVGYMEIQTPTINIKNICTQYINENPVYYIILNGKGEVFLANFSVVEHPEWLAAVSSHQPWYPREVIETTNDFISISNSNYLDWEIAYIIPQDDVFSSFSQLQNGLFIVSVAVIGIIVFFLYNLTARQARPLNQLVKQIEELDVDNLDNQLEEGAAIYEVRVLTDAFNQMQTRLKETLVREKALEGMQNKAIYDALQARISPHFLYNTLGSIANMCIQEGAKLSADACFDLSDLLRYSSQYEEKIVSLEKELEHLGYYLALMKLRYKHRVNYMVDVDGDVLSVKLPRLTLQPLIENAIKHTLTENEQVWIGINIHKKGTHLQVEISDNGNNFPKGKIAEINKRVQDFLSKPSDLSWEESMGFGGMGLTGTLFRLYLYFGESFSYTLSSGLNDKTQIQLLIPLEGGDGNV